MYSGCMLNLRLSSRMAAVNMQIFAAWSAPRGLIQATQRPAAHTGGEDMAQAPVPEELSNIPDHGERSTPHSAAEGVSAHLTETGGVTPDQEQPSGAASLCVSLLPAPRPGFDRAARTGAARPCAGLIP